MGNYIQYPIINHNGKEYEKNLSIYHLSIHTCITESLCCTPESNTTLEINYTAIKKKSSEGEKTHVLIRGWHWASESTEALKRRAGTRILPWLADATAKGVVGLEGLLLLQGNTPRITGFLSRLQNVCFSGSPIPVNVILRSRTFSSSPCCLRSSGQLLTGTARAPGPRRKKPSVADSSSTWHLQGELALSATGCPLFSWGAHLQKNRFWPVASILEVRQLWNLSIKPSILALHHSPHPYKGAFQTLCSHRTFLNSVISKLWSMLFLLPGMPFLFLGLLKIYFSFNANTPFHFQSSLKPTIALSYALSNELQLCLFLSQSFILPGKKLLTSLSSPLDWMLLEEKELRGEGGTGLMSLGIVEGQKWDEWRPWKHWSWVRHLSMHQKN